MSFLGKSIQPHPAFSHLNNPCIHSLQLFILAFCTLPSFSPFVPGDVDAGVTLWLVECFRILVQSGYPCPTFPSVPTVFRIDCNLSSLSSLEHSPHTCDPHHPFPSISTPGSTSNFPSPHPPHTFELLPSIPSGPKVDSLTTFFFIISRHNPCVYFLLFYSFNSIVLLFYSSPPHTPNPLVRTSLRQLNLFFPVASSSCCLSGIQERVQCLSPHLSTLLLILCPPESWRGLLKL